MRELNFFGIIAPAMFEDVQSECEIIPEKDFREAIKACRKDPELDRYFKFAPQAARRFIGLGFYSTHFGERADRVRYEAYLAKIEPTLKEADLKYLIRFEPDKAIRAHLKDLLAHPPPPPPVAKKDPPKPARTAKPSGLAQAAKRLSVTADDETDSDAPAALISNTVLKVALAIAAAVCVISICFNIKLGRDLAKEREERKAADAETSELRSRLAREMHNSKQLAERLAQQSTIAPQVVSSPAVRDEPEAKPESPEPNRPEPEPAVAAAPAASIVQAAPSAPKQPRIRLTDGTRIVRHPDGSIDVPREFSYAGAGLRKPFWPYDQALEKSGKIESEAQREQKALEEWRALRDEALRQAADG